jgi:hypothetical protein
MIVLQQKIKEAQIIRKRHSTSAPSMNYREEESGATQIASPNVFSPE